MFVDYLHALYHKIESAICRVFGENAQYRFIYFLRTGRYLNLKHPKDLNEKMFWLARYWRNPLITKCSDKFAVRDYIASKGFQDILNEQYGVYESVKDIDFSSLPQKFVLKCNHGSRMNIICENKDLLDIEKAKNKLS